MFGDFTTQAIRFDHEQAAMRAARFAPLLTRRHRPAPVAPPVKRVHNGSLFGTIEAFAPRTAPSVN